MSEIVSVVPHAIASIPVWDQYIVVIEHALDFLAKLFHNAGVAVIVFTILVKTAMLPLTITSIKSSKSMQELQPKIKELQKKYGKDRQKLSQETMRLYSQHKVNPMAGCLPMLIQLPIFFGLYRAILHLSQGNVSFDHSPYWAGGFLWLESLAKSDPYHVLPILAAIFQFVQTKMMRPANQGKITDPQQAMMNTMMNFMPLMVIFFGWNFASGPVIYWVTQSIYSVVQQWFITGWGSMKDWVPVLPELPEHRRLGYRPPQALDEVVVVSGEGGVPQQRGIMGWMNRKMQEAQGATGTPASETEDEQPKAKGPRPVKKDSPAAKAQREAAKAAKPVTVVTGANGNAGTGDPAESAAPVVPRKSRPTAPKRDEKAGSNGE